MKVKLKKAVAPNPHIDALVAKVIVAGPGNLSSHLANFKWVFDKGDFQSWVTLFNFFDDVLEKHVSPRRELQLDWADAGTEQQQQPFPTSDVLAILRTSSIILENCANKHLYQSTEHLGMLLAAPDPAVVTAALHTLMAAARKVHSPGARFSGDAALNKRLQSLASGWGGKEQGLDLLACVADDATIVQQAMQKATTLQFSFYQEAKGEGDQGGGLCKINVPDLASSGQSEHDLLRELVERHRVPKDLRFQLLVKIRVAKRFPDLEQRRQLVGHRLQALAVFLQAAPTAEDISTFFLTESDLVGEIISLVEAETLVPDWLRTLALRTVAIQLQDRQRHNSVISALSAGGQSGLLASLMQRAVGAMTRFSGPASPLAPTPRVSTSFVEALFAVILQLVNSTPGCQALASAGLIPNFLPMLKDHDPKHYGLVSSVCKILETYMDFVQTASTLFRDLGGLAKMIERLEWEIARGSEPLGSGTHPVLAKGPAGTIPYPRRNLIKFLMRAIGISSYTPGTTARPLEADQDRLFACLRQIMERSAEFGGSTFALAASVLTDLIHHDPMVFASLDKAGLPDAFISSLKSGVIASGEAISCVPTTLVAICLNTQGAQKVKDSGVLDCLVPVLTTAPYIRALSGETLAALGTGLDEMMRHVEGLREAVISMLLKVIRTLVVLGGGDPGPEVPAAAPSGAAAAQAGQAQPMEMEGPAAASEAGPSSSAGPAAAPQAGDGGQHLGDMIQRTARVIEALLGNTECGQLFVQRGGVASMLLLYELPRLAPSFGSHSPLHAATAALRVLAQHHAKQLAKLLAAALDSRLKIMDAEARKITTSVQELPEAECQQYTRQLQMTEGLLALVANVARMSIDLLSAICKGPNSMTARVSVLERLVAKQTTVSQEWKMLQDASKATQAQRKQDGASRAVSVPIPQLPGASANAPANAAGRNAVAVDPGTIQIDDPMQGGAQDQPSPAPQQPTPAQAGEDASLRPKKRTVQELSYDALIQFASTSRVFYVQIAKMIHNPSRRREEAPAVPPPPMQMAAAVVSITMRDALTSVHELWPGLAESLPGACLERPVETTQLINYITHMSGGLGNTLFDSRRRTCHSLILNYFCAGGGLDTLLDHLTLAIRLLEETGKMTIQPHLVAARDSEELKRKLLKNAVEGCVRMFLQLLDHLVNADQLLNSPQASSLLLTPIPGRKAPASTATAQDVVKKIQERVSAAVLPLWANPQLASMSPDMAQRIISIFTKCTRGTEGIAAPAARPAGRQPIQPDPATVQTIVDMGFSAARAEEALRRVQHNSVELAMEWLFNHPEEEGAPAGQPAAADAEAAAPEADIAASFPQAAEENQASSSSAPAVNPPGPIQLVDGAVAMLSKSPATAFALSDLLTATCRQKGGESCKAVLQRLVEALRAPEVQAPAHLLAVLTAENPTLALEAYSQGAVSVALSRLEEWLQGGGLPGNPSGGVPGWVDALLLILDQAMKVQRPPAPAEPAKEPKEGGEQQAQAGTASGSGSNDTESSRAKAQAAKGVEGSDDSQQHAINSLHATIKSLYNSGGMLSDEEQERTVAVCITLLRHLMHWTTAPAPDPKEAMRSTPASHARAVLQLLARLTKKHSLAQKALEAGVHHQILDLPGCALRPEHAAHICAIMRHLLEDPATLQAAMEAEIRSALTQKAASRPGEAPQAEAQLLKSFLTNMATIIGRDPSIFFEALMATCCVTRTANRPIIQLKPTAKPGAKASGKPGEEGKPAEGAPAGQEAGPSSTTPAPTPASAAPRSKRRASGDLRTPHLKAKDEASKEASLKSALKGGRKTIPSNFVEIIDTLVDKVASYKGVVLSDLAPKPQAAQAAEAGPSGVPAAPAAAPAEQPPGGYLASQMIAGGLTDAAPSAPAAPSPASQETEGLRAEEQAVLVQCIALKMLTDFTLMYTAAVGLILRRDAEAPGRGGSPRGRTPRKDAPRQTGVLLRHILAVHLAHDPEPGYELQSLAHQTSHFLLAVSIRSSEGRKRIVGCVVEGLGGGAPQLTLPDKTTKPPLHKVKALVELVTSLMCTSRPSGGRQAPTPLPTNFHEMMRNMVDAGVRRALLNVLRGLDLNHPKAPQLINIILKPLEVLTRSFLWKQKPDAAPAPDAAAPAEPTQAPSEAAGPAAAAAPAPPAAAPRPEGQRREAEGGEESEAGPDALAAAHEAMAHFESEEAMPRNARQLEDMMNAMIENAYDEEMDDYDSEGSEDMDEDMEEDEDEMDGEGMSEEDDDDPMDSGESGDEEDFSESSSDGDEHDMHDGDGPGLDHDNEEEVQAFMDAEEEALNEEERLLMDGPDFDHALQNAYQQGLDANNPDVNIPDEGVEAQFEDPEQWEDEEEEEEDDEEDMMEDEDGVDDSEGLEMGDMPGHEIDIDLHFDLPQAMGRGVFGGIGGAGAAAVPTQAMIEELFSTLGRAGGGALQFDPRRYRLVAQGQPGGAPARGNRPAQHALLQRPEAPSPALAAAPATHREMHPMATALMNQLHIRRGQVGMLADRNGSYLLYDRQGGRLTAAGAPVPGGQPQEQPQGTNPILTSSIEMLMGAGGVGSSNRVESRLANWSDDGLPPTGIAGEAPGLVAGTLEPQLASILAANQPPAAAAAAAGGAAGEGDALAAAAAAAEATISNVDNAANALRSAINNLTAAIQNRPSRLRAAAAAAAAEAEQAQEPGQDGEGGEQAATPMETEAQPAQEQPAAAEQPLPEASGQAGASGQATAAAEPAPEAEASDQEMAEAGPLPAEPPPGGESEEPTFRAADIEMGGLLDDMDESFLEALPPNLREEMRVAQREQMSMRDTSGGEAAVASAPEAGGQATAQEAAPQPSAAAAPEPAGEAGPSGAASQQPAPADDMDGIDPEFIAALPPDLQAEVLEQQRRDRRLREAAARRERAQQQGGAAAAAAPGGGGGAADMDFATMLATFPAEVREEVLLTSDESMLATLTPALLAEAQALRERAMRQHRGLAAAAAAAGGGPGASLARSMMAQQDQADQLYQHIRRAPHGGGAGLRERLRAAYPDTFARGSEADDLKDDNADGPPPIDDADVEVLVNLMRTPQMMTKQMLQRVFINLCGHHHTRRTSLTLLMRDLHPAVVDRENTEGRGLNDYSPSTASKRFLDLLIHMARFKSRVAQELVPLPIPPPTVPDLKGKAVASSRPQETAAFRIVFSLLRSQLCQRSNGHLVLALHLLEIVLSACKPQPAPAATVAPQELPAVPEGEEEGAPSPSRQPADTNMDGEPSAPGGSSAGGSQQAGGSSQQAGPSSSAIPTARADGRARAAQEAIQQLPADHLAQVAHILGKPKLSELAGTRTASVARLLMECAPNHRDALLTALDQELDRCGLEAAKELQVLASDPFNSRAAQAGLPVLRLLRTLTATCKATPDQALSEKQKTALDGCAARLEALWVTLSQCISKIEEGLGQQAGHQEQAHLLPPEAAQVLPFVEAFFVLCEARTSHLPQPEPGMLRAASSDLARSGSGVTASASGSVPAPGLLTPAASGQLPQQQRAVLDAHLPFLRFAETHRKLLNALLRQHSNLLEGSLAPLLRTPRLIDFDNKRAYFRSKVRATSAERHYNTLRINVRREHVFEDSFHQLRIRSPEEMRAKLSVHFQGEEGIDAGGVSREWYQVMAREMFNPNFSLFVPVPEGGTTFQPNPNSTVQNDEARGTNHLDFFKFVGRIVGKALYDGMFVDAYFTRSLYKHMLVQPLTYLDIEGVDPSYFKTLSWMLENDITDILDLTFTEEVDYFGRMEIKELKPGGRDIKVTEGNKREYINLKAQHYMTTAIKAQLQAFLQGFWDLIPQDLVKIFNDHELELLISGLPEIDIEDLKANTEYAGYSAASKAIQWFWQVVRELNKQDLALLVQFVTGTSKVPLEGFSALQGTSGAQKFQIHRAYGAQDRLPSSHTCFNQLDLIEYDSIDTLRTQLLTAIREGSEGFGFG